MKEIQPLTTYQRGALCFLSIRKKAKANPHFSPLLKTEVFITSDTWQRTKVAWRLDQAGVKQFLTGYNDASKVKAGPKDHLA